VTFPNPSNSLPGGVHHRLFNSRFFADVQHLEWVCPLPSLVFDEEHGDSLVAKDGSNREGDLLGLLFVAWSIEGIRP
jgi:hypothetical protein